MHVTDLPTVNATLNGLSALLLAVGYVLIRTGRNQAHGICMLAAFGCSIAFLISYLIYHAQVGSVPFKGTGGVRVVYFSVLISHTLLAASVPFLAVVTVYRALRQRFARHVAVARWALPVWLYVSVTGVVVYWMLYRMGYGP